MKTRKSPSSRLPREYETPTIRLTVPILNGLALSVPLGSADTSHKRLPNPIGNLPRTLLPKRTVNKGKRMRRNLPKDLCPTISSDWRG